MMGLEPPIEPVLRIEELPAQLRSYAERSALCDRRHYRLLMQSAWALQFALERIEKLERRPWWQRILGVGSAARFE